MYISLSHAVKFISIVSLAVQSLVRSLRTINKGKRKLLKLNAVSGCTIITNTGSFAFIVKVTYTSAAREDELAAFWA